jgi:hypothetical protein
VVVFGAIPIAEEVDRVLDHVQSKLRCDMTRTKTGTVLHFTPNSIPTR